MLLLKSRSTPNGVLTRSHLWRSTSASTCSPKVSCPLLVGTTVFPLMLSQRGITGRDSGQFGYCQLQRNVKIRQLIYLCWRVQEPWGCDNPRKGPEHHTHHGKETPPYPAHIPELGSLWTCTWGDKEAWHCGARLPGVMGTADGFGWRRVAARRAGATGGGGGSGCSSRAAVAPRVGRHTPSAKTRRKASGTWTRKGGGLQVVFG